ncbi:hypothetical protein ACP3S8_18140 [Mixta calida]|uniref:hypothetical protein n=1 Tax=Mixta calida TaxID=665913 RepID=UPI003CF8B9CC
MRKKQEDKRNMPFFDTVKTTAVIGLLMQQAASLHYQDGLQSPPDFYTNQLFAENVRYTINPMMEESLGFIKELTEMLNEGYSLLSKAVEGERNLIIASLDPAQVDLVELQLRGLEGAVKNAYRDYSEKKAFLLKPALITIAQARSAASKLNNLISQMTRRVDTFESSIDMQGLQALVKHGTEVFHSGRFH